MMVVMVTLVRAVGMIAPVLVAVCGHVRSGAPALRRTR
jgi:hypothetical protein